MTIEIPIWVIQCLKWLGITVVLVLAAFGVWSWWAFSKLFPNGRLF